MLTEQYWNSADGLKLYGIIWHPASPPKAVMAFVHGHGTHSRRYDDWFGGFVKEGLAVISFDLRGHGKSGGERGMLQSSQELLNDVKLLYTNAVTNFPSIPVILYGHSMGATLCLTCLQQKMIVPQMAILAAPWLKLVRPPGFFRTMLVNVLNLIHPNKLLDTRVKKEDFSPAAISLPTVEDPLMHKRMSVHYFYEIQKLCGVLLKGKLPGGIPILLMHGSDDRIASHLPTSSLALKELEEVEYKEWLNAPHQLHAWDQSSEVTKFTVEWINNRL